MVELDWVTSSVAAALGFAVGILVALFLLAKRWPPNGPK